LGHASFLREPQVLNDLARVSGYRELPMAPLMFVGHSAGGPQAKALAIKTADRCFGLVPFELSRIGPDRYILVGRAEQGVSPTKDALFGKSPGKTDGYLMILDWKGRH
jgi:hypothetical protein